MRTLLIVAMLAACSIPEGDSLSRNPLMATLDNDNTAGFQRGNSQRLYPTTGCETVKGYLPYITYDCDFYGTPGHETHWPQVDTWILCTGTVGPGSVTHTETPIQGIWIVGHHLYATPFEVPLAPGCQLMVSPIVTQFPQHAPPPPNNRIGSWSNGDTSFLLIRPHPGLLGHSIYVQFGALVPGENALFGGALISHTVHFTIGNTTWGDR